MHYLAKNSSVISEEGVECKIEKETNEDVTNVLKSVVADESTISALYCKLPLRSNDESKSYHVASTQSSSFGIPFTNDGMMPPECNTLYTREVETMGTSSTYPESREEEDDESSRVGQSQALPESSIDSFHVQESASTGLRDNDGCAFIERAYFLSVDTDESKYDSIPVSFTVDDDDSSFGGTTAEKETAASESGQDADKSKREHAQPISNSSLEKEDTVREGDNVQPVSTSLASKKEDVVMERPETKTPAQIAEEFGIECEFVLKSPEVEKKDDKCGGIRGGIVSKRKEKERTRNKSLMPPGFCLSLPKVKKQKRSTRVAVDSFTESACADQTTAEFNDHVVDNDSRKVVLNQFFDSTKDILTPSGVELALNFNKDDENGHSSGDTKSSGQDTEPRSHDTVQQSSSIRSVDTSLDEKLNEQLIKDCASFETRGEAEDSSSTNENIELRLEQYQNDALSQLAVQSSRSIQLDDGGGVRHNKGPGYVGESHDGTQGLLPSVKSSRKRFARLLTLPISRRPPSSSRKGSRAKQTPPFTRSRSVGTSFEPTDARSIEIISNKEGDSGPAVEVLDQVLYSTSDVSAFAGVELSLKYTESEVDSSAGSRESSDQLLHPAMAKLIAPTAETRATKDAARTKPNACQTTVFIIAKEKAGDILMEVAKSLGKPVHVKSITIPTVKRRSMASAVALAKEAVMFTSDDKVLARTTKSLLTPLHVKPISLKRTKRESDESRGVVGDRLEELAKSLQKPVQLKPVTLPAMTRYSAGARKPTEASARPTVSSYAASSRSHVIIATNDKAVARAMKSLFTPLHLNPIITQCRQRSRDTSIGKERQLVKALKKPVQAKPISLAEIGKSVGARIEEVVTKNNDKTAFKVMKSLGQPVNVMPISFGEKKGSAGDNNTTSTTSTKLESWDNDGLYSLMEASSCGFEIVRVHRTRDAEIRLPRINTENRQNSCQEVAHQESDTGTPLSNLNEDDELNRGGNNIVHDILTNHCVLQDDSIRSSTNESTFVKGNGNVVESNKPVLDAQDDIECIEVPVELSHDLKRLDHSPGPLNAGSTSTKANGTEGKSSKPIIEILDQMDCIEETDQRSNKREGLDGNLHAVDQLLLSTFHVNDSHKSKEKKPKEKTILYHSLPRGHSMSATVPSRKKKGSSRKLPLVPSFSRGVVKKVKRRPKNSSSSFTNASSVHTSKSVALPTTLLRERDIVSDNLVTHSDANEISLSSFSPAPTMTLGNKSLALHASSYQPRDIVSVKSNNCSEGIETSLSHFNDVHSRSSSSRSLPSPPPSLEEIQMDPESSAFCSDAIEMSLSRFNDAHDGSYTSSSNSNTEVYPVPLTGIMSDVEDSIITPGKSMVGKQSVPGEETLGVHVTHPLSHDATDVLTSILDSNVVNKRTEILHPPPLMRTKAVN